MAKNQVVVSGKMKNYTDITVVAADKSRRAKLQNYIDEVVRCQTKILDEKESIKTLRESAVEELNIDPKMFTSIVALYFNNNFEQKRDELERLQAAIDALMQTV